MLLQTIDSWAIQCPDRVAHHYRDNQLTYLELKKHSDALANWLMAFYQENTLQRQLPIIVWGHKENEMLISFLAAVKSGNPYIPVDSSVPSERLQQILSSSQAQLILSPETLPENVKNLGIQTIENFSFRSESPFYSQYFEESVSTESAVQLDEVYYIIYTSGSTGVPKGVQITLRALESYLNWVNTAYSPSLMKEVYLNQAPFSFDLSVMDLYMSLSTGGTLWSVDKLQITSHKELFASLKESQTSIWVSTPSFADFCLLDRSFNQELLPDLKRFLFCGEVLTHDCASKLIERFPQALVENLYGPTEATVATTTLTITPEILAKYNPLPVGARKPDSQVLICNSDRLTEQLQNSAGKLKHAPEVLEEGERGEIIIAGPNVSIGYLNNPTQTEKAFFSWEDEGVTWQAYRTGDAGSWNEGNLFFYGRLDFQVKLHGYRIELGDIEENLRKIEWVENAVVLPIEKRGKVEYLQAFMTTNQPISDQFAAGQAVRNELKKFLPDYMIPRRFSFIDQMPMTPNGKADRRALLGGIQ